MLSSIILSSILSSTSSLISTCSRKHGFQRNRTLTFFNRREREYSALFWDIANILATKFCILLKDIANISAATFHFLQPNSISDYKSSFFAKKTSFLCKKMCFLLIYILLIFPVVVVRFQFVFTKTPIENFDWIQFYFYTEDN